MPPKTTNAANPVASGKSIRTHPGVQKQKKVKQEDAMAAVKPRLDYLPAPAIPDMLREQLDYLIARCENGTCPPSEAERARYLKVMKLLMAPFETRTQAA